MVRPLLGAGLEYQYRFVSDAEPARQLAFYLEAGVTCAVSSRLSLGLATSADVTFRGGLGAGLGVRALVGWVNRPSLLDIQKRCNWMCDSASGRPEVAQAP